ncbi:MAG: erythromycin esterase family protein, partial [Acidobacteriaceae bacterium]
MLFGRSGLLCFIAAAAALATPSLRAQAPGIPLADPTPIVNQLCGKQIALLGESPVHGFARTLEFKVDLAQRLVNQCHYNAVFFESGLYDFLNLEEQAKSGHPVADSTIAAAIGGLWANTEVQPLIPFLRKKVNSGALTLGGLDDQLGRGTWAQHQMPAALTASLPAAEKTRCLAILQKYMLWQYPPDAPYGPQDKARILGCLDRIQARLSPSSHDPARAGDLAMIASLRRLLARDFQNVPTGTNPDLLSDNQRDLSMFRNFRWLLAQLPPHSKVIVWTATVHAAKDLSAVPGDENRIPLGLYIHREFGSRAFVLGFSADSGSYAFTGQPIRQLSPAPPDSLEARSFAGRDAGAVYLSPRDLREIGAIPARPLRT